MTCTLALCRHQIGLRLVVWPSSLLRRIVLEEGPRAVSPWRGAPSAYTILWFASSRPTMCLLGSCLKELPPLTEDNVVYELPVHSRDDLVLAACFSPFMFSHSGATHSDALICTDASDTHTAATASPTPKTLSQELWRLRERRGRSSHLGEGFGVHFILWF